VVARRGRRQIDPEPEAVNCDAFGGDFIVDQSPAGGHPLRVAWQDRALMTLIVVVTDAALDDIGHGLGAGACQKLRAGTNPPSAPRTGPGLRSPRIAAGISGLT
jgi:hypothetical protein